MHRRARILGPVLASLTLIAHARGARAQPPGDAASLAAGQALYEEATKAMDARDYAAACPKLEEVVRLVPQGIGGRLTLARCYEGADRLASAYTNYALVEAMAGAAQQLDRQREAHARAEALKPRVSRLTIVVAEGVRALGGLEVKRDGAVVGAALWGVPIPVDKGRHVVTASAGGKRAWQQTIDVTDNPASLTMPIDALADVIAAPVLPPPAVPPPPPAILPAAPPMVLAPAPRADAPELAPRSLSHRGQLGLIARADVDGTKPGVAPALGLAFGIGDHVEINAAAVIGKRAQAAEPGMTVLFLKGAWKPRLSVGVPVFFLHGDMQLPGLRVAPGVHGAAGLEWDPSRHLGLFVDVGVVGLPSMPAGYQKVIFVPAIGIEPRL